MFNISLLARKILPPFSEMQRMHACMYISHTFCCFKEIMCTATPVLSCVKIAIIMIICEMQNRITVRPLSSYSFPVLHDTMLHVSFRLGFIRHFARQDPLKLYKKIQWKVLRQRYYTFNVSHVIVSCMCLQLTDFKDCFSFFLQESHEFSLEIGIKCRNEDTSRVPLEVSRCLISHGFMSFSCHTFLVTLHTSNLFCLRMSFRKEKSDHKKKTSGRVLRRQSPSVASSFIRFSWELFLPVV